MLSFTHFCMSLLVALYLQIAVTQPNCMKVLPLAKKENTHRVKCLFICVHVNRLVIKTVLLELFVSLATKALYPHFFYYFSL